MTLTGRFSTLFLTALAIALLAFSASLYVVAKIHLERQVAERVAAALDVLAAAAEIHPDCVEWEPDERFLPLGQEDGLDQLRWVIRDPEGNLVDDSINLADADLPDHWPREPNDKSDQVRLADGRGRLWLAAHRRVMPGRPDSSGSKVASRGAPLPPTLMDPPSLSFPSLEMIAYGSLEPAASTLRSLLWFLIGLSGAIWAVSSLLCRRLSRRALKPLQRLVASARELNADDPGWSLEAAGTGDELDELGRTFNDLLIRLHGAYEQQRAFSGNASHQLRTPLTIVMGQIEVALRKERSGDEYRRVLGASLDQATRLSRVIESLLLLSQVDLDAGRLNPAPLNLDAWVPRHLASYRQSHHDEGIDHIAAEPSGTWVRADETLMGILLDNLLENARKHGGPDTPIRVETNRDGSRAILAVEDHGPGLSSHDAARVFEPFYRSEAARSRRIPGAGLGLAVVARIVRAFHGDAHIAVPLAPGCRIEIHLPLAAGPVVNRLREFPEPIDTRP